MKHFQDHAKLHVPFIDDKLTKGYLIRNRQDKAYKTLKVQIVK